MRQITCHLPDDVYKHLVNKAFQENKQIGWIIAEYVKKGQAPAPQKPKKGNKNL